MADKNLHDIKIDELDSPKKTPLKNIVTLIALLFIILVISIVITKLILNTDEGSTIENNDSKINLSTGLEDANKSTDASSIDASTAALAAAGAGALAATVPTIASNIKDSNLSSVIKRPLTSHEPKKEVEAIKTYKEPKAKEPKATPSTPKAVVKKEVVQPKQPKKHYVDRVVVKKEPSNPTAVSTTKNATFLGGKQKKVSNSYYIKVGTYRDTTTMIGKIKKNNFNYSLVKVENDTTLTRVLVGPFFSRNQAAKQLSKVKANILPGAYITKAK